VSDPFDEFVEDGIVAFNLNDKPASASMDTKIEHVRIIPKST